MPLLLYLDELLAPSSRQILEEKSSLREAMKLSSSAPSNIRKSLLQGGVASCLHLLTRVASNARKMMEIRTMRKNLRSRTRPSHIALLVVGALLSPALPRLSWRKCEPSILFGILGVIGQRPCEEGDHGHTLRPCRSTTSSCTFAANVDDSDVHCPKGAFTKGEELHRYLEAARGPGRRIYL